MLSYKEDELWQAVTDRDLQAVRHCIANGGNVNMVCPDGWVRAENAGKRGTGRSLLHHAAWSGDLRVFKTLVEAGADVGRRRTTAWRPHGGVQGRGSTPLHHAVMYGRHDIVKYLLNDCGVDMDEPGEQGFTALHLAAKFNLPAIAEMLLQAGARTDLITRDEKTAYDLAKGQQDRAHAQMGQMAQLFEQYDPGVSKRQKGLPLTLRSKADTAQQHTSNFPKPSASYPMPTTNNPYMESDLYTMPSGALVHAAQRDPMQEVLAANAAQYALERRLVSCRSSSAASLPASKLREDSLDAELRQRGFASPPEKGQRVQEHGVRSPSYTDDRREAHVVERRGQRVQEHGVRSPSYTDDRREARGAYHDATASSQHVGNHDRREARGAYHDARASPQNVGNHDRREARGAYHDATASSQNVGNHDRGEARGAYHDATASSQNVGNHIGTRSSVRQSKLFRMYESGNATKALLGQESLVWDTDRKEGAYQGHVFDAFADQKYSGAGDGRVVYKPRAPSTHASVPQSYPSTEYSDAVSSSGHSRRQRRRNEMDDESPWATSSSKYGAGCAAAVRK